MAAITASLRWYPGDPLVEISAEDLERVAREHGASVTCEQVVGKGVREGGGPAREETRESTLEEITQTVVSVSAPDEESFRRCVRELIRWYRAPRTTYATWGSTDRGKEIVRELADEDDGWY